MASRFPFELNPDNFLRQLWNKETYLYLAEFFRRARFVSGMPIVDGASINDYRHSGENDDWCLPGASGASALDVSGTPALYKVPILLGWKKTAAESDWAEMSLAEEAAHTPTRMYTEFVAGTDSYPWYGLRLTWEYPRTH